MSLEASANELPRMFRHQAIILAAKNIDDLNTAKSVHDSKISDLVERVSELEGASDVEFGGGRRRKRRKSRKRRGGGSGKHPQIHPLMPKTGHLSVGGRRSRRRKKR